MNKSDFIGILALILIVVGAGCLIYYFVIYEFNSCTSDPLKYAFDTYAIENMSYEYVDIRFYTNEGDFAPIKVIELDMTGLV